jgi:NTE family protein
VNKPLEQYKPGYGYVAQNIANPENSDKLFLILSFSGGGTRAAAFSYGVLEELRATEINFDGKKRRLVDEVDVISSVSGGSFTAAYYGLYGDRIFEDYESRFLKKDIQGALLVDMFLNPINWFRLSSPFFDRSDLAAEYYDKNVFDGKTFGDMLKRKGPMILINATDMSMGTRFTFHQTPFNAICSDLSAFRVARACAASSAVPGVLTPITLNNYAGSCGYVLPPQFDQLTPNFRLREMKDNIRIVLDPKKKSYFHLIDGGVADNLGLRAVEEVIDSIGNAWTTMKLSGKENVHKVVFIVVNAETKLDSTWDKFAYVPDLAGMLNNYSSISIIRYNRETIALLLESSERWTREVQQGRCPPGQISTEQGSCGDIKFYMIEVSFRELKDTAEGLYLSGLPTSFRLSARDVDRLKNASHSILKESGEFQRLLQDLAVPSGSDTIAPTEKQ